MREITVDELGVVSGGYISTHEGIQLQLALAGLALVVSGPVLAGAAIAAAAAIAALPDPDEDAPAPTSEGSSGGSSGTSSSGGITVIRSCTGGSKIKVKK